MDSDDDEDIVIKSSVTQTNNPLFAHSDSGICHPTPFTSASIKQASYAARSNPQIGSNSHQHKNKSSSSHESKETIVTISSSSQPINSTPKRVKASLNRTTSEIITSSSTKNNLVPRDIYLDSDSESELNPPNSITGFKSKERLLLSSTPEKIDASSSIGEIRISKHSFKPLYSLNEVSKQKSSQKVYSDEDLEVQINEAKSRVESGDDTDIVPNAFLDRLVKHTKHHDQRRERLKTRRPVESSTSNILANLSSSPSSDPIRASPKQAVRSYSETALPELIEPVSERPAKRGRTTATTRKSKQEREEEKQRQLKEKQRQLKEKQDRQLYQDANRSNRKKDDLMAEMIIRIPHQVIKDFEGNDHKVELAPIEIQEVSNSENVVSWSRKIRAKYDANTDTFQPCDLQILDENICAFIYTASDFLQIMEMETLTTKFTEFKRNNKQYGNFIIIINGYEQALQKLKNQENRNYTAKVRSQMNSTTNLADDDGFEPGMAGTGGPKKKTRAKPKSRASAISSLTHDEIEAEIAQLQVHGFKIFPTKTTHETLLWLRSFSYTISSARYDKLERNPDLANIGTIKSGVNTHDTYLKMLLQFKFMTEVKAKKIIDVLPTMLDLYNAVNCNRIPLGLDGRPLMNSNIHSSVRTLLSTMNDGELLEK